MYQFLSCLASTTQDAKVTISLRKHRRGRSGNDLVTWNLDYTALRGPLGAGFFFFTFHVVRYD